MDESTKGMPGADLDGMAGELVPGLIGWLSIPSSVKREGGDSKSHF